ncbi:MAG: creatininase family protein [Candidatus Pelethousia sp.]|nr:creatininase family protein [Candidatus Pelethousia sp.]
MIRNLNTYTWDELTSLDREKAICLFPISALEQHGKHLPLGTDDFILSAAMGGILDNPRLTADYLLLPALHYGNSAEHMDFLGTVSLSCATIVSIMEDVLRSLATHGFKKLAIINSHGGNSALLQAYAQEWQQRFGIRVYHVNFFVSDFFTEAAALLETPLSTDVHAGELETSILLYAMPEAVRQAEIVDEADVFITLQDYYSGWLSSEYTPGNGVIGVPTRANVAKGETLLTYIQNKLVNYLFQIACE